jgi:hypothetical protein
MPELQLQCFHCKTVVTLAQGVPFNLVCEKCQTYLHSCGNCRHYVHGQCNEPEARATPDPGQRNICDWFMPRVYDPAAKPVGGPGGAPREDPRAKLAKLFGDPPPPPPKPRNPFGDK